MPRRPLAALLLASVAAAVPVLAQFKTVGPAPYSAAVARQKIRTLLAKIEPANRKQTISTISGLLVWFRDVADDELIAAWKKDTGRQNLPEAMIALADARVAQNIVEYSWRQNRDTTFQLAYAPMFQNLMLRFPESAKPFVDDLLASTDPANAQPPLNLSEAGEYTVCRILLDMPEIREWPKIALQVLAHHREAAETLVEADISEGSSEKRTRAMYWRDTLRPTPAAEGQRVKLRSSLAPPPENSYEGSSGTMQCRGEAIPQNGEYVFYNVPTANRRFDYDRKIWDVRLEPGQGDTRNFILKNKSSKAQKGCTVRWSVIQ